MLGRGAESSSKRGQKASSRRGQERAQIGRNALLGVRGGGKKVAKKRQKHSVHLNINVGEFWCTCYDDLLCLTAFFRAFLALCS